MKTENILGVENKNKNLMQMKSVGCQRWIHSVVYYFLVYYFIIIVIVYYYNRICVADFHRCFSAGYLF